MCIRDRCSWSAVLGDGIHEPKNSGKEAHGFGFETYCDSQTNPQPKLVLAVHTFLISCLLARTAVGGVIWAEER
eukprot:2768632-Rhodomonas_salina.1